MSKVISTAKYNSEESWITLTFEDETTSQVSNDDVRRQYTDLYNEWLSEGNIPEPEFTPEELAEQARLEKVFEAKSYLASTDFYMTVDKYATLTEERKAELTQLRAEARVLINELEVTDE